MGLGGRAGIDMVIKNWKVRPFVVLLKKHEKRFRFRFFFCSFPSFWWSGGGYGSATVTGRYFFFFLFFLVKRPQWLSESLWWVNCFLFFVAVVCFVFLKIDPEHSHETFFFLIQVFLLIIDFDFFEALELIDMHNNDGFLRAGAGTWAWLYQEGMPRPLLLIKLL